MPVPLVAAKAPSIATRPMGGVISWADGKERWGWSDNYARRLMGAAEVCTNLQTVPIGTLPQSETQARPLTKHATATIQRG